MDIKILTMGEELVNDFSKLSHSPWESHRPPVGVNIDRHIAMSDLVHDVKAIHGLCLLLTGPLNVKEFVSSNIIRIP